MNPHPAVVVEDPALRDRIAVLVDRRIQFAQEASLAHAPGGGVLGPGSEAVSGDQLRRRTPLHRPKVRAVGAAPPPTRAAQPTPRTRAAWPKRKVVKAVNSCTSSGRHSCNYYIFLNLQTFGGGARAESGGTGAPTPKSPDPVFVRKTQTWSTSENRAEWRDSRRVCRCAGPDFPKSTIFACLS